MRSIKDGKARKYSLEYLRESPPFASWANRNISTRYTPSHWCRVHGIGMLLAIAASASADRLMHPLTIFLFTAVFLTPMIFNAFFHAAASVYFRSYSPGTASALSLFPVLCWNLVRRFSEAGLLDAPSALAATVVGATIHCIDLASTTFFLQRMPRT